MTITFDTMQSRTGEGLSFYLKAVGGDWYFRVGPVRDPDQPRFWRLLIEPCSAPTSVEGRSRYEPYLAAALITRENLSDLVASIKATPMAWLQEAENQELAEWLRAVAALDVPERAIPDGLRKPPRGG